jgi:hypothetical protein
MGGFTSPLIRLPNSGEILQLLQPISSQSLGVLAKILPHNLSCRLAQNPPLQMWLIFEAAGEDFFFELTGSETVQQVLDVFKTDYEMGGNLVMAYGAFALTQPDSRVCDVPGLHEMSRVTVQHADIHAPETPTFSVARAAPPFKSQPAKFASEQLPRQITRPVAGKPHIVKPITRGVVGPRR